MQQPSACCLAFSIPAFCIFLAAFPAGADLRVQSQTGQHEDLVTFSDNGDVYIYQGFLAEEATPDELANDPVEGELVIEGQDGIPVARIDHESGILYLQGHAYPNQSSISEGLGPAFEVQLTTGGIAACITAAGNLFCLGDVIQMTETDYTLDVEEEAGGGAKVFEGQVELLGNKIGGIHSWQIPFGKRIRLVANPAPGNFFSSWIDEKGDVGILDDMPLRMRSLLALRAVFSQSPQTDWPDSMVAFGDSSSLAVLSSNLPWGVASEGGCSGGPVNCFMKRIYNGQPKHSWSTGDAPFDGVRSHYERILIQNPAIRGHNYNMAVSGASLYFGNGDLLSGEGEGEGEGEVYEDSLRDQMQRFSANHADVDYATIWMGGIDVCGLTLREIDYKTRLKEALIYFRSIYANAVVVVVQLPDIVAIYDEFYDFPGCMWQWINFGISGFCPRVLGDDNEDRQAARTRNLAYNQAISEAVDELNDSKIFVVDVDFETDVIEGRGDLSLVDCFHPTKRVQQRLAEKAWDADRF